MDWMMLDLPAEFGPQNTVSGARSIVVGVPNDLNPASVHRRITKGSISYQLRESARIAEMLVLVDHGCQRSAPRFFPLESHPLTERPSSSALSRSSALASARRRA